MRPTLLLIALTCGLYTAAQVPLGRSYWKSYKQTADSVVMSYFGRPFFERHIRNVEGNNFLVHGNGYSSSWEHRDTITAEPSSCHFAYAIVSDSLSIRSGIQLTITPEGLLVDATDSKGLVHCDGGCAFRYTVTVFTERAIKKKVKGPWEEIYRGLEWVADTSGNGDFGHYELTIGQPIATRMVQDHLHNNFEVTTYRAVVFDPFTGEVLHNGKKRISRFVGCLRWM